MNGPLTVHKERVKAELQVRFSPEYCPVPTAGLNDCIAGPADYRRVLSLPVDFRSVYGGQTKLLLVVLRSAIVNVLPKANDWTAPEPHFSELSKLAGTVTTLSEGHPFSRCQRETFDKSEAGLFAAYIWKTPKVIALYLPP